jgi:hypothetical protein
MEIIRSVSPFLKLKRVSDERLRGFTKELFHPIIPGMMFHAFPPAFLVYLFYSSLY